MSNNLLSHQEKELQIQKTQLEIKKIEKEIEEIGKPKNSKNILQWITALSPLFIGFLTVFIAWNSGFLQAQSKLNETQELFYKMRKDSIDANFKLLIHINDS